jgi:ferredoxin
MALRIVIDRERCVGSGNCLYWAPGTFDLDDDGVSVVVHPDGDDEDRIRVAAEGCPTRAISLEDRSGPGPASVEPTIGPEGQRHEAVNDTGNEG